MELKDNPNAQKDFKKEFESASTLYEFSAAEEKPGFNIPVIGTLGVLNIALIAYFIFSANYLGAFLFLLSAFTVFMIIYNRKKKTPAEVQCKIRSQGVQLGNILYPYENLQSFWIFYDPPYHKEISIRSQKTLMDHIKIPVGDEDPVKIREILLEFLPEKQQEESFVDIFARNIGF